MAHQPLKKDRWVDNSPSPAALRKTIEQSQAQAGDFLQRPRQGIVQGRAPGETGSRDRDLHIHVQRHGEILPFWSWSGEGSSGSCRQEKPDLGRTKQVTIMQLFLALSPCDNRSLIRARALQSGQSCGGGASRGTPDVCSQAICLPKLLTSFPGKTLGTLAESSCSNFKLQNASAPLPFSPYLLLAGAVVKQRRLLL